MLQNLVSHIHKKTFTTEEMYHIFQFSDVREKCFWFLLEFTERLQSCVLEIAYATLHTLL